MIVAIASKLIKVKMVGLKVQRNSQITDYEVLSLLRIYHIIPYSKHLFPL